MVIGTFSVAVAGREGVRLEAPPRYRSPPLLARYRGEHQSYDLHFAIAPVHEIAERVAHNDLDMAVITGPLATGELQARLLTRDELVLVAAPHSVLTRARAVTLEQLRSETWLVREEGSDTRRQLEAWWHRHRIAPGRTMMFTGPEALKRAAMAGLGVAMASRLTVEEELANARLRRVPVKAPLPTREILVVDHPQKHHGAASGAMLQLFEQVFPVTSIPSRARSRSALFSDA